VTDRAAEMTSDVLRSAESLAAALDAFEGPVLDDATDVRFVGLGSSRFAALTVAAALRAAGRRAAVDPASSVPPLLAEERLVAISSSGRTPETVEAARRAGRDRMVAVTNDPAAPLAAVGGTVVALAAGEEQAGVATLTYRATLAVLALVSGVATAGDLRPAVEVIDALVVGRDGWLEAAAGALDAAEAIDVVVEGGRLGSAEQAALMLREAPRLRAEAREAGEWAHTAIYTVLPGQRVILLGPTAYDRDIAATAAGRGATVVGIGSSVSQAAEITLPMAVAVEASPVVRALVESVAVDLVAARLWELAKA
jgi:glucosamine--fructose-6-phosphate aminotransferase (isomerizing)